MDLSNTENQTLIAVLVSADTGEFDAQISIDELEELAKTAGVTSCIQVIQKRPAPDPATYIGSGRLEELRDEAANLDAQLLIFDCELTANQIRNIEAATDIRTIDRTTLILDIFAQRAISREGKIQVELAQQKYRLAHLAGKGVELSRLGGGIGTRGPGESKLETDRRHIRQRIKSLEESLKEIDQRRELIRSRRKKDDVLTAAIVGYTNAGKSTLLNSLTQAGVLAEDKLFATLDVTTRSIELPDGRSLLLADTVGLISRLPHKLIEAFKSTLEEAANADILLNVIDVSSPECEEKVNVMNTLLSELGCDGIPRINVLNKCDLLEGSENISEDGCTVKISAKNGTGFDELLKAICNNLPETAIRGRFLIPYDKSSLLNTVRTDGKVYSEEYTADGTLIDALVDIKLADLYKPYLCNK
ncbi:MAG: GTPase HflX [Oscillospiraceae bacterium]|nr:GTPase HflX [Oscillospiraceae bacterium]